MVSQIPGATTNYEVSFTINTSSNVGSIGLLFCSNDPLEADACTAPTGFDVSNATVTPQNGIIDITKQSSTANSYVLTHTPSVVVPPLTVVFSLNGVVNPSAIGSYYLRIATYASTDGTGPSLDFGGLAFTMNDTLSISTRVPPYLGFCTGVTITGTDCSQATGDYINFGNVSSTRTSSASSQFVVATNAQNGYQVQVTGTTLTSGNNVINTSAFPDVSRPGTSQFGMNLRANTDPVVGADPSGPGTGVPLAPYDTANKFLFRSGDAIADATTTNDYRKYTVSYIVNVALDQPVGVYASTLTYVATGNF
jgi:hypothetical protein